MQRLAPVTAEAATSAAGIPESRGEPRQVICLLPLWGLPHLRRFLTVALPTWLAPGNLPALVHALPTEMVILTARDDEAYLRSHPGFRRLAALLPVQLHFIDHLITGNNYSTTITLAYTEAVRAVGAAMLDTCFVFLVGDYIIADGSLGHIIQRMMTGLSGILVGNFQVAEEDAAPWLQAQIDAKSRCTDLVAAASGRLGAVASASGHGRQHGQFWRHPKRPYQPAVLARRRPDADWPLLPDAHDQHPARNDRFHHRCVLRLFVRAGNVSRRQC